MVAATQEAKREFKVAILTPYLSKTLNINGTGKMELPNFNVLAWAPEYDGSMRTRYGSQSLKDFSLLIAGSTTGGEEEIRKMKGSGLVVARYSIFYGGNSGYTGRTPEEGGYALDIPKIPGAAAALLMDEATLEALLERNPGKVRKALATLSAGKKEPILATPYLEEALGN